MKYKILKDILTIKAGSCLFQNEGDDGFPYLCTLAEGKTVNHLWHNHRSEYFEEVKEPAKPRWKVGDYVVNTCTNSFIKIFSVSESNNPRIYNESGNYYYITESDLRDPTPEELSLYFR